MKRARGLILLGLFIVVVVVRLCLWLPDQAAKVPMGRGEPLDYWLKNQGGEIQAAVAEMDEKCVS